tara:strand:+ start:1028 stop:1480 length:453 start_codon:yes stop_codon:yes gene_type:complete
MVDINHICRNEQSTLDTFEKYKGQLVIADSIVKQFVGIALDPNDYIYVFYNGREFSYSTILSKFVPLKGKIDDKDYNEYIRIAYLNWFSIIDQRLDEPNEDITKGVKKHKIELEQKLNGYKYTELLADICWDLEYNGKGISPEKEKQWPQ